MTVVLSFTDGSSTESRYAMQRIIIPLLRLLLQERSGRMMIQELGMGVQRLKAMSKPSRT